ncbi:MAG: Rieske (2Fe-2S) protein [Candidatus Nanopelagicales bacterium]|nr:Rieske (2Fe-2S) protein [Candidatus Nanopelagicales bacterium]
MSDHSNVSRRTVLAGTGIVAVGVAVAACAPGSSDEANPEIKGTNIGATGTVLAAVSDVPVGGGVVVSDPPIVVTQPKAGQVNGFTAICPHAGCLVASVVDDEIICPCHGSRFSAVDGSVIQGPATQGLEPASVSVKGTNVVLA